MEESISIFNEYAKTYDMTDENIMARYHHTLRVRDIAILIAKEEGLDENDILLVSLCALLHDIARFEQWTKYQTFKDGKSVDHGDLGYEILSEGFIKNFNIEPNDEELVLKVVKYHNKLEYSDDDPRVCLFTNIVKDADKLDILEVNGIANLDEEIVIKDELVNIILEGKITPYNLIDTNTDVIINYLSWINDFNFKYSYQYLKEHKILGNKIHLLELYGESEKSIKIKEYINNKLKEKVGN